MLRLTHVSLRGVLALAGFIALQPGLAFSDANSPYCWPEERFAPDGRIVELGGRYFRVCWAAGAGKPYSLDPTKGRLAVRISERGSIAHDVEAATNPPKFLWGFMTFKDGLFDMALTNLSPSRSVNLGEIPFGDQPYTLYADARFVEKYQGRLEKGNLPKHAFYVFERPADSDIPSHMMTCRGDPSTVPREEYSCHVYLRYRESDHLIIKHRLSWAPIYAGGPMDFERLTDLVRAVHALFEHVDVTDRLDTLEGVPIVRARSER
jgi:hypothetical protein